MNSNIVTELDLLVSDYLIFRKCESANELFASRDEFVCSDPIIDKNETGSASSKILTAFDDGDYFLLLNLWETCIVKPSIESGNATFLYECKACEFLCNLHGAVYPFRSEFIRKLGKNLTFVFSSMIFYVLIYQMEP